MMTERYLRGLTRPFRQEAAGLKTPAASNRPLPLWVMFGGDFLVILLLAHYSFIIRSLFVLIRASCE